MKTFADVVTEHVEIVQHNFRERRCTYREAMEACRYLNGLITRLWKHYRRMQPGFGLRPEQGLN